MLGRLTAFVATTTLLATAATALADVRVDVPDRLGKRVDRAAERSGLRVLLPQTLRVDGLDRVFPGHRSRDGFYSLDLGAVKGCRTATACFVAAFIAEEGERPSGGREVDLARGRTGRFTPSACGASCSAPQVQWRERGVLYTIQAEVAPERRRLVALANSAIRNGAR